MSGTADNSKKVRDDEIDLLDLFRRIGRKINNWGNAIGKAFLVSIVFLIKKWIPLTISILLGIILTFIAGNSIRSSYTSDLVLKVNIDQTDEVISKINRLHRFSTDNNKQFLTEALNLNPADNKNILDINAYWIIDNGNDSIPDYVDYDNKHNIYDTTNVRMKDRCDIRIKILKPQELSGFRDGIINFIKNDPLFQQRNNLRIKQNDELITRLEYDIIQLDSLQKFKYFEEGRNLLPRTGGQMIFLQEQKTQLLYNDIYNLYKRKQKLELEQDIYKDVVTVISDFSLAVDKVKIIIYSGRTIIPLFFFLTLTILILRANRRKLREIYHKY